MKRIACFILSIAMLLTLCACGSNNVPEATGTNQQNTPNTNQPGVVEDIAPEDRPVMPADHEYTLSEYLATGETIWYMLDENEGKDSAIKRIFVINPDGTLYTMKKVRHTLGELEQMDDADIVAMVKTEYAKQCVSDYELFKERDPQDALLTLKHELIRQDTFLTLTYMPISEFIEAEWEEIYFGDTYYEEVLSVLTLWQDFVFMPRTTQVYLDGCTYLFRMPQSEWEGSLASMVSDGYLTTEDTEKLKDIILAYDDLCKAYYDDQCAQIDAFMATVQPCPYRLVIVSDSTGNNTSRMELVYQITKRSGYTEIDAQPLTYIYPAGQHSGNSSTVVYDSLYGGYYNEGDYLFTRVSADVHFMLDAVGTYDIPIDVKDYATLFD